MKKFFAVVWGHVISWPELYVGVPLVLLTLVFSKDLVYFLTGSEPKENMSWLVDLSGRVVTAMLVIIFTSFERQASGVWMSKQEQFDHSYLATLQHVTKMFCIVAFMWLFTH